MPIPGLRGIRQVTFALAALCTVSLPVAGQPAAGNDELAREQQIVATWKADRVASLTSDTGWTTLAGLLWLKSGDNSFGSAKSNQLQLDNPALAAQAGTFHVQDGKVSFTARKGAGILHDGKPVSKIALVADPADNPTLLQSGSLTFFAIERAGKLGVRVRDSESPHRKNFQGLEYFPVDTAWVFNARFEPYANKQIPIVNILGMTEDMVAPGALVFSKDGKEYRLDAVLEEPGDTELFVMFADATNTKETYGAGRFLYVPMPKDGKVRLDFNKAYNPPCAFTAFATCPLPPKQNWLPLAVRAGEKNYGEH
jgi:uncharacterized protein (DUF1684 family)